jgi:pyruvyl transferase EpsO
VLSRVLTIIAGHGPARPALGPAVRDGYAVAARSRVLRGVHHLSRARAVITDRLHAHVFCTLLGIPHVVLPSADGKIVNLLETWTERTGLAKRCDSAAEGFDVAMSLAGR